MSVKSTIVCASLVALATANVLPNVHPFNQRLRIRDNSALDPAIDQNASNYYTGYKAADYNTAWAKYWNDTPISFNPAFEAGLAASPVDPSLALPIANAGAELSKPGYLPIENGYTILEDGTMVLAIQTFVPENFTGEMYDFWFSWHVNDTTKYKLWYPAQHQYAAVNSAQIEDDAEKSSYRERYWNVTSFVDEYIGPTPYKLSIAFFDPAILGFETETCESGVETIVTGFVTISVYSEQDPTAMAENGFLPGNVILAHQVRARPDGSGMEIRSRFWFGAALVSAMRTAFDPLSLGRNLSIHCANEMTHLGTFLPALFEEFRDDIPTGI